MLIFNQVNAKKSCWFDNLGEPDLRGSYVQLTIFKKGSSTSKFTFEISHFPELDSLRTWDSKLKEVSVYTTLWLQKVLVIICNSKLLTYSAAYSPKTKASRTKTFYGSDVLFGCRKTWKLHEEINSNFFTLCIQGSELDQMLPCFLEFPLGRDLFNIVLLWL